VGRDRRMGMGQDLAFLSGHGHIVDPLNTYRVLFLRPGSIIFTLVLQIVFFANVRSKWRRWRRRQAERRGKIMV